MSLTQAPILTYPDPSAMFILDTDASGTGIGAVLSQVSSPEHCSDPEQERVVAYYSCTLSRPECHYCYPQGTFSSGEGYQTLSCLPLRKEVPAQN